MVSRGFCKRALLFFILLLTSLSFLSVFVIQPVKGASYSQKVTALSDDAQAVGNPGGTFGLGTPLGFGDFVGANMSISMRWLNLSMPRGSTILSANVTFYSYSTKTDDDVNTNIFGEDADNATTFTDRADWDARNRTSSFVAWDALPSWNLGSQYTTPDLTDIIQEIVNRTGWDRGNPIVIFVEDDGSDLLAYREAYSRDNSPGFAPELTVTYRTYTFICNGLFDEETGLFVPTGVNVTAYFLFDYSPETFEVNGSYVYSTDQVVYYFHYELGANDREYWISENELSGDLYIFNASTTFYTVAFLDFSGGLKDQPFVQARRNVNGTSHIIDKRKVDAENKVQMSLINGVKYSVVVLNGASYTFGDVLFTSTTTIQLTIKALAFPLTTILIYNDVRLYWERTFGSPTGNITLNYEDLLESTNQVEIFINYRNGTNAYNNTETSNSFVHTWTSAINSTDYQVIANINHTSYGLFIDRNFLPGELGADPPFDLGFFGSLPFDTAVIIPALLILFVAGCFSMVNVPLGAFLTVVLAGAFVYMGWISIESSYIITALCIVIIMGIIFAKRRMKPA